MFEDVGCRGAQRELAPRIGSTLFWIRFHAILRVEPSVLGSGEHADDDLVEQTVGSEEKPTLDRAAGDLEEGATFRSVPELSCLGRGAGGKSPVQRSGALRNLLRTTLGWTYCGRP
jgi:hypothetical protein